MSTTLRFVRLILLATFTLGAVQFALAADPAAPDDSLAARLRAMDATVIAPAENGPNRLSRMLADDAAARMRAAVARENDAWRKVATRDDWDEFCESRLRALRASLGTSFADDNARADAAVRVTGTFAGDAYEIQNVLYQSWPGLYVTANLYLPATPPKSMPGILISHSHHSPKTQGELQDMGVTWARLGCAVLVPDHLGHGERRQHPFLSAEDYPKPFKAGRQDYYFRYNEALQLHLAGESLIGWMVRDLSRGVDVLLGHAGADKHRILLIGGVAGGGDPAGVAAALDPRITAVAPFNFGGPQPDYAIPADAERDFYFFGVPWWESTRCLRNSAQGGFAHWVIVASVAPRGLLYCHEFAWDKARNPAWPRIEKVFGLYGAADKLASATGRGSLKGEPPENTHCGNVGPVHRAAMYPAIQRWLGIEPPVKESNERRSAAELMCLTPKVLEQLHPPAVHDLANMIAAIRSDAARMKRSNLAPDEQRRQLRETWAGLLGSVEPAADPKVSEVRKERSGNVTVERATLEVEPGIVVPIMLLLPARQGDARLPVVVAFAQEGKSRILRDRSAAIADLLAGGAAVCLADLRGTGETALRGKDRGRNGEAATIAQTELMLGRTLLGSRLRDLRSVLRYVRARPEIDTGRIALWGDSFAPFNADGVRLEVPLDADDQPGIAEPLGGLLATFGMLFDEDMRAAYSRGGLVSYESCLRSPFVYIPPDAVIPGAIPAGDLPAVIEAIAPRAMRFDRLVDGLNRPVSEEAAAGQLDSARSAYRKAGATDRLMLGSRTGEGPSPAAWLLAQLRDQ